MILSKLLDNDNLPKIEIKDITCDSRAVEEGSLFFALTGVDTDGTKYIEQALEKGAAAVVARYGAFNKDMNNLIESRNPRADYSKACFNFYGKKQPAHLIAVTGTNGKTSIANFTRQIWELLGYESASIGTIGVVTRDSYKYGERTTPDSKELYKEIADLTDKGITHLAIEASSHGIIQNRLDDLHISGAGFTNLTPEHLDYHNDMSSYYHAKARLFSDILPSGKYAVLNADIKEYKSLRNICLLKGEKVISFGENGDDIKILETTPLKHGQKVKLNIFGKEHTADLQLIGSFQASNLACAIALAISTNPELINKTDEIAKTLPLVKGVDGRMEFIGKKSNGATIYVDYAHSPDGLENMLKSIRPHVESNGRLICVFGCGGDRDKTKRPIMGKIANDLSDIAIISDDNPRTEDASIIREEIKSSCPKGISIGNRAVAIKQAIEMLGEHDLLIIAGKGHETGQVIGKEVIPFNDKEEVLKNI
ncbi:MAG: UDP-N-acetylmuramoyl-L-alanyl-D-glutamate--2,6-diaminopimelate ligase [Alphaproteobacteria bacterium]|jgi:UDP-N-acetylmuramoyl-L-alanyl-D-glutamate--2,6-diaminopimelate ligase|nr:UDP-N-acetylmuramoyl-L-alanyl-D-glutamate--2,6-diaminopimelate ligase [Alphaproteobacteria bacterium]